jgi:hypothetical protein
MTIRAALQDYLALSVAFSSSWFNTPSWKSALPRLESSVTIARTVFPSMGKSAAARFPIFTVQRFTTLRYIPDAEL